MTCSPTHHDSSRTGASLAVSPITWLGHSSLRQASTVPHMQQGQGPVDTVRNSSGPASASCWWRIRQFEQLRDPPAPRRDTWGHHGDLLSPLTHGPSPGQPRTHVIAAPVHTGMQQTRFTSGWMPAQPSASSWLSWPHWYDVALHLSRLRASLLYIYLGRTDQQGRTSVHSRLGLRSRTSSQGICQSLFHKRTQELLGALPDDCRTVQQPLVSTRLCPQSYDRMNRWPHALTDRAVLVWPRYQEG